MQESQAEVGYEQIESVMGFVVIGGFILCLKRNKDDRPSPDKWIIPGTRVSLGEEPIDSLFRQIKKDAFIGDTRKISYVGKYKVVIDSIKSVYRISTFQLYYDFPVYISLASEYSDFSLCSTDEILELDFSNKIVESVIEQYLKRIGDFGD